MTEPEQKPPVTPLEYSRLPLPVQPMLGWSAVLPLLIFVVIEIRYGWPRAQIKGADSADAGSKFAADWFAYALLSLAPSWIMYRICRRSKRAGSITFWILSILFTLVTVDDSLQIQTNTILRKDLSSLSAMTLTAQTDASALSSAHWLDLGTVQTSAQAEQRLAMIDRALQSNEAILKAGDAEKDSLKTQLGRDVPSFLAKRALHQLELSFPWPALHTRFVSDNQVLKKNRPVFAFLVDHEKDWQYDHIAGRIVFHDANLVNQFQLLFAQATTGAAVNP